MKKLIFFAIATGVVLISLTSCEKNSTTNATLYTPTESDTTSNATLVELQQGRELYINNCQECHQLYSPDDFSASRWNTIVAQMAPKTNLSQSEIELVKKYLKRGN